MNGPMAVTAHRDGNLHLLASISRLKPLVAVASTRNQMMLGRSQFDDPIAQLARVGDYVWHLATVKWIRKL